MLHVHQLRRVFDAAMQQQDSFLIFEVLERLHVFGRDDLYDDWRTEALPMLAQIKSDFREDYLIHTAHHG